MPQARTRPCCFPTTGPTSRCRWRAVQRARWRARRGRWVETRSESMTTRTHGRAQVQDVELGAMRDGTLAGVRVRVLADCGAYPGANDEIVTGTRLMATGPYRIPRVDFRADMVVTNT